MTNPLSENITSLLTEPKPQEPPFGANEIRLNLRQWLTVFGIVLLFVLGVPHLWGKIERFDTGGDYRIPYALSSDYWLYHRRIEGISPSAIPILGDSVVWGEYVRAEGTLSHFLNAEGGQAGRFVNGGVNGLFPLSLEGLVASYAGELRNRKIILHCNLLWMSSPKADLSTDKEETFNHPTLVPQFSPKIPCYRGDASTRLGALVERNVGFFSWVKHLNGVYFAQQSLPRWTLARDSDDSSRSPNLWRNPLAQVTLQVPTEPKDDPQRGLTSSRHKAWTTNGSTPTSFEWVDLNVSLQWAAFQRTVKQLRERGNSLFVIVGPFNAHMVAPDQRTTLTRMQESIAAWLKANGTPSLVPEVLPSDLYADASHPLTAGYSLLAHNIYQSPEFKNWLGDTSGTR